METTIIRNRDPTFIYVDDSYMLVVDLEELLRILLSEYKRPLRITIGGGGLELLILEPLSS